MIIIKYKNIPIASYDWLRNNIIIPDEAMEEALSTFKNAPIVFEENVVGIVEKANSIDKENKVVYGDIHLLEPRMSIQVENKKVENDIVVIEKFKISSIDIVNKTK